MTNTQTTKIDAIQSFNHEINPIIDTISREDLAAKIRELVPVVRSAKWRDAVEAYAELVEDVENPTHWAYFQGGVWFSYAVLS